MTNQHTDEARIPVERRMAIAGYNGCLKAKRNEFCLPCVVQATGYNYKGESDRRRGPHSYSPKTPYGEALIKAIAEGADEYSFSMGYRCALDMFTYQAADTRYQDALREAREAITDVADWAGYVNGEANAKAAADKYIATINKLLGDKA